MKQIAVVMVMLISIGITAQRHDGKSMRKGPNMDMSAEEMATLQTKRMTLALDLTEAQQDRIYDIHLENATFGKNEEYTERRSVRDLEKVLQSQKIYASWQEKNAGEREKRIVFFVDLRSRACHGRGFFFFGHWPVSRFTGFF